MLDGLKKPVSVEFQNRILSKQNLSRFYRESMDWN